MDKSSFLKGNAGLVASTQIPSSSSSVAHYAVSNGVSVSNPGATTAPDKVLSVSGKKKCSHCGEELGKLNILSIELTIST